MGKSYRLLHSRVQACASAYLSLLIPTRIIPIMHQKNALKKGILFEAMIRLIKSAQSTIIKQQQQQETIWPSICRKNQFYPLEYLKKLYFNIDEFQNGFFLSGLKSLAYPKWATKLEYRRGGRELLSQLCGKEQSKGFCSHQENFLLEWLSFRLYFTNQTIIIVQGIQITNLIQYNLTNKSCFLILPC